MNLPIFIRYLILFIFSLFIFSCNEDAEVTTAPVTSKNFSLNKPGDGKGQKDTIKIVDSLINNALPCGDKYTYSWSYVQQYRSVQGKHLGIWTEIISKSTAYKNYGFNMMFVYANVNDINAAHNFGQGYGYNYDSMMVGLSYDNYENEIEALANASLNLKNFYLDEPKEKGYQTSYVLHIGAEVTHFFPSANTIHSSYQHPDCYWDGGSDVTDYHNTILYHPNHFIMCDQFHGNCCGVTDEFWTAFRSHYGTNKNFTNFMHILINNGKGHMAGPCQGAANSFYDLFLDANESGMNQIWLFAAGTGANENDIITFCNVAWSRGWLLRKQIEYRNQYRCVYSNPCLCDPNDLGDWDLVSSTPTGQFRYVAY